MSPVFLLAVSCAASCGLLSIPLIWMKVAALRRQRMPYAVLSLLGPTSVLSATPLPRSPCLGWSKLSLFQVSLGKPTLPRHRRLHLEACRVPGAGAWLTANPSCVDSHVSSPLFRVALQRRLRMPLWDRDTACSMCGEVLDRWGDHALACCCGGDRVLRHNAIRDVVCSAVAEFTTVSPELEKPGLLPPPPPSPPRPPDPGGPPFDVDPSSASSPPPAASRRPADVWVPRGVSGFAEAWDFSVSSLLRSSHLSSASPSVADVFHEVETRKRAFQDTASLVAERGATFCPLVLEACGGGWSQALRNVVAWIALSPAWPAAQPPDPPRTSVSGLHSASAAPFTGKTRVQSCDVLRVLSTARQVWLVTWSPPPVGDLLFSPIFLSFFGFRVFLCVPRCVAPSVSTFAVSRVVLVTVFLA